jgi:hypothetical protein
MSTSPAGHAISVDPIHRLVRQRAGLAYRGAEEGAFLVVCDRGGGDVLVKVNLQFVPPARLIGRSRPIWTAPAGRVHR